MNPVARKMRSICDISGWIVQISILWMAGGGSYSFADEIDRDSTPSASPTFNTQAVVQIQPAFDSLGRSCTALQVEPKIFLLAGHCLGYLKKSILIPQWSSSPIAFKLVHKIRQPAISNEGTPEEKVNPAHDLGLLLVQPKGCGELKKEHQSSIPLDQGQVPSVENKHFEIAAYGGSGLRFARIKDGNTPSFEALEQTQKLQTTVGHLFDCKETNQKLGFCEKTQELIRSFQYSDDALYSVARRTMEITHTPVIREFVTSREGPLFLEGDSGAVMIQTQASGQKIIRGVLSGTGSGSITHQRILVLRPSKSALDIAIQEPSLEWIDPSRSSLSFVSVKTALAARKIDPESAELRRSYTFTSIHFFSSIHHPKNKEFLEKGLEELRKKREEKFGCN
jgi:hypothetical protein